MNLLKIYTAVNAILNTVDFNALFEGFHKYRFKRLQGCYLKIV